MQVKLDKQLIAKLQGKGVSTFSQVGAMFPEEMFLEPPCSLKWMSVHHSLHMGAFSYAVSGFYFGCRVGRYCSFGEQVQIGRHAHPLHYFSSSPFFYRPYPEILDQELPVDIDLYPNIDYRRDTPPVIARMTEIGHDVWIGHGAFVLPGVRIGHGAVVAAQSVVTKDIPPYAIVAGSPARIKRYRFSDNEIERLLDVRWWDFAPWDLKGAHVDDIPSFLDFVVELRDRGILSYSSEVIDFAALVNDKEGG